MRNDSGLIKKAQQGDHAAFEELVILNQQMVYNHLLRMSKNEQDAYDLSQETFLRAYRAIKNFKLESSFSTWIYRIASNVYLDFYRKNKNKKVISLTVQEDEKELALPDAKYDPECAYERIEKFELVKAALEELSDDHKRILIMRTIDGLSYREISERLELNEGTVKSRIARARMELRKILNTKGNYFDTDASNGNRRG